MQNPFPDAHSGPSLRVKSGAQNTSEISHHMHVIVTQPLEPSLLPPGLSIGRKMELREEPGLDADGKPDTGFRLSQVIPGLLYPTSVHETLLPRVSENPSDTAFCTFTVPLWFSPPPRHTVISD